MARNHLSCLACDSTFSSRKQLSAHTSQCAYDFSLTDQIFSRKRKSEKKKKRKEKRARHDKSPDRIPEEVVVPDQQDIQDDMYIDQEDNVCIDLIYQVGSC